MSPVEISLFAVAAFATAALTAVAGLGGGIILLAIMLLFLDPLLAIPVHAAIQLVSNASRTWIQRTHVEGHLVWRFAWLLLPFTALGIAVVNAIPPAAGRVAIGVFALVATWRPEIFRLGGGPRPASPERRFVGLGALVGFTSATLGASGPLLAPFLRDLGLARQGVIATFSACQSLAHGAKILGFGLVGFAFATHLPLLLVGSLGVVAGTWLGSRLLEGMSEAAFVWIYRAAITGVALRLVLVDGIRWLGPILSPGG